MNPVNRNDWTLFSHSLETTNSVTIQEDTEDKTLLKPADEGKPRFPFNLTQVSKCPSCGQNPAGHYQDEKLFLSALKEVTFLQQNRRKKTSKYKSG